MLLQQLRRGAVQRMHLHLRTMMSSPSASSSTTNTTPPRVTMGPVARKIQEKITEALHPTNLEIVDDSHKHAGHTAMKGLKPVETHFRVTIVSEAFTGMPLLARHRLIYGVLGDELRTGLHALQLKTKTPAESEGAPSPTIA